MLAQPVGQLGEPRASDDDIGGVKGECEPLRRVRFTARGGIGVERVVAELVRGKTRARMRIGLELDERDGMVTIRPAMAGRGLCLLLGLFPFSFGDLFF